MEFSLVGNTPTFGQYYSQTEGQNPWTVGKNSRSADVYRDWASLYYPNAFQASMLNYQNEYEKPINQMLRYQEAGLNPYSFQAQQSASGAQGSKPGAFAATTQDKVQNALKAASTLSSAVGIAKELYDYCQFGFGIRQNEKAISASNLIRAQSEASKAQSEADWSLYWNYGQDFGPNAPYVQGSPRARYMEVSTNRIDRQVKQLDYFVDTLYPSQKEALEARAALQEYQKEIQQGNYDAILNINTGNKTADAILRMLAMMLMNNASSFLR